jgi:predicted RNA binding protein YcfA (HicA-like mRNA interferase family)
MGKLPSRTGKQLLKILLANGFILDRVTGSHHILINKDGGRRITVPVHARSLPKGTLHEVLKQAGLSPEVL